MRGEYVVGAPLDWGSGAFPTAVLIPSMPPDSSSLCLALDLFLNAASLIRPRIIFPLLFHFPHSLVHATIFPPFKTPFDAKYFYAGGSLLFVAIVYVGMEAVLSWVTDLCRWSL